MKALVIDDVVPIQNMLKKMLLAAGVDEVVTAATGEAGYWRREILICCCWISTCLI